MRAARDWLVIALAWVLILAGGVMLVLPGPGLLGVAAGVYLLSRKSRWVRARLERGARLLRRKWPAGYKRLMRAREKARERRRQVRELIRSARPRRAESAK